MTVLTVQRTRTPGVTGLILAVAMLLPVVPATADSRHELLLFPSVDGFQTLDETDPSVEDSFIRGSIDVLYSYSTDKFRFLGEYLLSTQESELERLKAGWTLRDDVTLWVGRTHTTSKHWTSEYHHGQYLQTSITRPSLEEWEDESGPIPSHVTGLSLDVRHPVKEDAAFNWVVSTGLAPRFVGEELHPFDILNPESEHGLSANLRLSYQPRQFEMTQFGLISSWNDINVDSASSPSLTDLNQIEQFTVGAFADWRWNKLRLIASYIHFDIELDYVDGKVDDDFDLGYLQLEYPLSDDITIFGRTDNGFGEDSSPYLRLLPAFISHRHMLGMRWDVASDHALTMEIADTAQQAPENEHENFKEIRLQWSAVF